MRQLAARATARFRARASSPSDASPTGTRTAARVLVGQSVVHLAPPDGGRILPCCNRSALDVPVGDGATRFWTEVTCPG